ncbi:MAG: hypothetical protein HY298_23855 [Verrucomicrobia bacterium]|nr:hypothetical protein [Verrucomicrobiota bacterium]
MKTLRFVPFIAVCLAGCTTAFWTDMIPSERKKTYHTMFAISVKQDIKAELKSEQPWNSPTWRAFWIRRCEQVYHSQGMGDPYVQYIVDQRREAGLPDIPEIINRDFRTAWECFRSATDPAIEREAQGLPPPALEGKTWPDYWRIRFELTRFDTKIGEKGVTYIKQKREELHLPPVAEPRKGLIH